MFNFFHNLGIAIVSALTAFTGAFHTQTVPVVTPIVQVSATTTLATSTPITTNVKAKVSATKNSSKKVDIGNDEQIPTAPVNNTITPQPIVSPIDLGNSTTNLVAKFHDFEVQVKSIISQYGYTSLSGLSGSDYINATTLNSIEQKIGSSVYDLNSTSPSQKNIDYYTAQYNTLYASFIGLGLHVPTSTEKAAQQAAQQAATDAQTKAANEENLKKVRMKLAELNGYTQEIQILNPDAAAVNTVISMLPSITDLNGDKIFTTVTTPYWGAYTPSSYIQQVLLVIQKQVTQLNILQAQYSN
jgi:hypothetical protein